MRSPWFPFCEPASKARIRLFCLPPAGGTARLFLAWRELLPRDIAVWPVEFPGRAARMMEHPMTAMSELAPALYSAVVDHCQEPFAIFGHSMGALVAFELAHRLQRGSRLPVHLFVAGARPPHMARRAWWDELTDDGLTAALREVGGFPGAVLDSPDLMQVLLPIFRADATVTVNYTYAGGGPLQCALTVLAGESDPFAPIDDVRGWRPYTAGPFSEVACPGRHDFLCTATNQIVTVVAERLALTHERPQHPESPARSDRSPRAKP